MHTMLVYVSYYYITIISSPNVITMIVLNIKSARGFTIIEIRTT